MLAFRISLGHIARCQDAYLAKGARGAEIAEDIRLMTLKFESQGRSFARRQARGAGSALPDGRVDTLRQALFDAGGRFGWPWGAADCLAGLRLDMATPLPAQIRIGMRAESGADCYCVPMTMGPEIAREFGKMIALAVYLHPTRTLWIVSIGPESDGVEAMTRLRRTSGRLADWPELVG